MQKSNIQWTDATWNIARGCTKVDEDCKFCYMYRDSMNNTRYNPLEVKQTKGVFNMPLKYKETESTCWDGRPLIFTCSLTDFFHEGCDAFRAEAWDIIRKCPHLIFQILTKRPERIRKCLPADWGDGWDNVWLGVSVEDQRAADERIPYLLNTPALVRFLSCEPLLGPVDLTRVRVPAHGLPYHLVNCITGITQSLVLDEKGRKSGVAYTDSFGSIDWVIVGGESGNDIGKYRYRPCELEWIEKIVSDCQRNSIPVFVKQMGTHLAKQLGMSDRHGGKIEEFPEHLQIREFPRIK